MNTLISRGDYIELPSGDRGTIQEISQDSWGGIWVRVRVGIEGERTTSTQGLRLIYTREQLLNGQRYDSSEVRP